MQATVRCVRGGEKPGVSMPLEESCCRRANMKTRTNRAEAGGGSGNKQRDCVRSPVWLVFSPAERTPDVVLSTLNVF